MANSKLLMVSSVSVLSLLLSSCDSNTGTNGVNSQQKVAQIKQKC